MSLAWKQTIICERDCKICGNRFSVTKNRPDKITCGRKCAAIVANKPRKKFDPTPQELQAMLLEQPATKVAARFGVTDSAIVKRAKSLGLYKPGRGIWNCVFVGKRDVYGALTIAMVPCQCGCGRMIPKWSGRLLRRRRYLISHNSLSGTACKVRIRRREGGRQATVLDLNALAIRDCLLGAFDDATTVAIEAVLQRTENYVCDYLAVAWLNVQEAWGGGERDLDRLFSIVQKSVKQFWKEERGRARVSIDDCKERCGFEPTDSLKLIDQ